MFNNVKMGPKLLLVLTVPIIGMLFFATITLRGAIAQLDAMRATQAMITVSTASGGLIHELQKERGLTAGLLASKGEKFKDALAKQRQVVDAALQKFQATVTRQGDRTAPLQSILETAAGQAEKLAATRSAVDSLTLDGRTAVGFYSNLIATYLNISYTVVSDAADPAIALRAFGYTAFQAMKEANGQLRAAVNGILTDNSCDTTAYQQVVRLAAAADLHQGNFLRYADPALVAAYREQVANAPAMQQTAAMLATVLARGVGGGFAITPESWFTTITAKIDLLKGMEETLADRLSQQVSQKAEQSRHALIVTGILTGALALLALALGLLITAGITRPLKGLVAVLHEISQGDGDLAQRLEAGRGDEIGEVARSFNLFAEKIHEVVVKVIAASTQVTISSSQFQTSADLLAQDARAMAAQTVSVATASEEMAATSSDIARNCTMASQSAEKATERAETGSQVVQKTLQVMEQIADLVKRTAASVEGLGARSDQIGAIVGTIEDIADQTNLLALNAAIEAARAGEMGRGFAVVADEVRALAERTTKATKEIAGMIRTIQQETGSAVQSMSVGVGEVERGSREAYRSGEALQQILSEINQLTMEVHQIATAAEEQTATTTEISNNIHQVNEVVTKTANGTRETISASNRLLLMSDEITGTLGTFRVNEDLPLILARAKAAHIVFVGKIRAHLDRDLTLKAETLPTHLTCRFGSWYAGAGATVAQRYPQLRQIEAPHERVHALGKEIIRATESGERKKAWTLYNQMHDESQRLIGILDGIA